MTATRRTPTAGLSPRTRGKLRIQVGGSRDSGPIPADAGETTRLRRSGRAFRAYPRGRGGNAGVQAKADMALGLSPRTRGKRSLGRCSTPRSRPIPADAGETRTSGFCSLIDRAYPRGRGGNSGSYQLALGRRGLSPRTRGKLPRQWCGSGLPGPIPADAGETQRLRSACATRRAYPRGRGGNALRSSMWITLRGLSPRTRGKLRHAAWLRRSAGPIPADAGETFNRCWHRSMPRAYPRGRGGNSSRLLR